MYSNVIKITGTSFLTKKHRLLQVRRPQQACYRAYICGLEKEEASYPISYENEKFPISVPQREIKKTTK